MSKLSINRLLPWMAISLPIGIGACNKYEMFMLSGYEQVSFSSKVDVLFVIDGSASMSEEAGSLLRSFDEFIETVAGESGAGTATESLADAVGDYISFTADRGKITDYRLAITTASMDAKDAWSLEPEGGETGLFVGDNPVVYKDDADATHRFKQNLGCWAACWNGAEMESNSNYTGTTGDCPFPDSNNDGSVDENDEVTTQYLDCLCTDVDYPEGENWDAIELCRGGNELHLESTLMALCRATDDPPEICYHTKDSTDFPFEDDWIGSNVDWLRDDSTVVVVYVTDEGDQSERIVGGLFAGSGDDDPQVYLDAFDEFDRPIRFAAIGPDIGCESGTNCNIECNTGGSSINGVKRLKTIAESTGGFYNAITTGEGNDCEQSNFAVHLNDLGKLLINLQTAFELQSIPDETTIRAYIDDEEIEKASLPDPEENAEAGENDSSPPAFTSGWSYDPGQNAVVFWGSSIPDFNQDVRIYYRPVDGKPRDLPF